MQTTASICWGDFWRVHICPCRRCLAGCTCYTDLGYFSSKENAVTFISELYAKYPELPLDSSIIWPSLELTRMIKHDSFEPDPVDNVSLDDAYSKCQAFSYNPTSERIMLMEQSYEKGKSFQKR
jgi:hypothetical protein